MKLFGRHKYKKDSSVGDDLSNDHNDQQQQQMLDLPSADDRKFLQHASEEAVTAWNSTHSALAYAPCSPATHRSSRLASQLPENALRSIFAAVCPQSGDETYETCERSAAEATTCALCDTRDLAHCAMVSKRWRASAIKAL